MKKKVNICDKCNKAISEFKCVVCDKDICTHCVKEIVLLLMDNPLNEFNLCKDCYGYFHTKYNIDVSNVYDNDDLGNEKKRTIKSLFNKSFLNKLNKIISRKLKETKTLEEL